MTKYQIEQDNNGQRAMWVVKSIYRGRKHATWFETKAEAEKAVQSYIEDDSWNAANRD